MKHARNNRASAHGSPAHGWGGRRVGAGRPAGGERASERHKARPPIASHHAVHVIARTLAGVLVGAREASAIDRAVELSRARADFRIVHLGIRVRARTTQLELIVEATDKHALARGMQGFQVSAARGINRAGQRTGSVFADRYRARVLASRPAVRRAIESLPARAQRLSTPASSLFAM